MPRRFSEKTKVKRLIKWLNHLESLPSMYASGWGAHQVNWYCNYLLLYNLYFLSFKQVSLTSVNPGAVPQGQRPDGCVGLDSISG